ncbi:hypothetical protein [Ralstonia mannitolilytica]|uniref:hypothetical protein n=1 Tax=Ralstonia mannitolilytica TaxID=105219 RepID=UPI0028F6BF2D|nr:hypothetical protein [Ralstonia mannitolilytica]CAJ0890351.1 hypothetical protein R76727_04175 [Ralstonia mannitolilytica]
MKLKNAVSILLAGLSGLLGVLLVTILLSGRIESVKPEAAIAFNTNLQLCMMLVTLYKLGADSIILSKCTKSGVWYGYVNHFRKILPIAVIAIAVSIALSGWVSALIIGIAALFDTYSVLRISELNSKRKFEFASVAGAFYIPVACLFLIFSGISVAHSPYIVLVGSVSRFIYVWIAGRMVLMRSADASFISVSSISLMLAQQGLNFLMFRGDQLLLGLLYRYHVVSDYAGHGIVWSKLAEFYSAGTLIFTTVLFPSLVTGMSVRAVRFFVIVRKNIVYVVGAIALAILVFSFGAFLMKGRLDARILPFFAQSILIVPANLITYVLFRSDKLIVILISSGLAVLFGLLFAMASLLMRLELSVLFVGFIQLLLYVIFAMLIEWKRWLIAHRRDG